MRNLQVSEKRIFLVLSLSLWIYLWLRALSIPMAHDEVATFFYYVHRGKFFPFFSHWDTNNHYLNSALTWVSYYFFGSSPLALRIPNLLFAPVFFFYCFRLSTEIRHPFLRWTFILSLCVTHSFLEFFAISRGYGISMALLFGAIWYLMRLLKTKRIRHIGLCLIFMMLATYSNLALINTYFLMAFLILVYAILNDTLFAGKDKKILALLFWLGFVPIGFMFLILLRLKLNGNLWAGSSSGLWNGTVRSLVRLITTSDAPFISYFVAFCFFVSCLLFVVLLIKRWNQRFFQDGSTLFFYLLAGNLVSIIILGNVFKINYPEDRIALYLFPLFIGCVLFLLDQVKLSNKYPFQFLLVIPLLFLPVQFFMRLNLSYMTFYADDNIPWRFYDKVYADWVPGTLPPTISGHRGRHFCWSYLDFRNGGKLSDIYSASYPGFEADFQIVNFKDHPDWRIYYDSVDNDKYSGRQLLKRKVPLKKTFISGSPVFSSDGEIKPEFFVFYEMKVDTLAGKTLYLTYDMAIHSDAKPFIAWIVVTVSDNAGKNLRYECIPLDWLRTEWKGTKNNFLNVMFVSDLPQGSDKLTTYIWNQNNVPFRINNGRCSVFKVIPDY